MASKLQAFRAAVAPLQPLMDLFVLARFNAYCPAGTGGARARGAATAEAIHALPPRLAALADRLCRERGNHPIVVEPAARFPKDHREWEAARMLRTG